MRAFYHKNEHALKKIYSVGGLSSRARRGAIALLIARSTIRLLI